MGTGNQPVTDVKSGDVERNNRQRVGVERCHHARYDVSTKKRAYDDSSGHLQRPWYQAAEQANRNARREWTAGKREQIMAIQPRLRPREHRSVKFGQHSRFERTKPALYSHDLLTGHRFARAVQRRENRCGNQRSGDTQCDGYWNFVNVEQQHFDSDENQH